MKKLSTRTGIEIWMKPRYAIARFMNNKSAFKTTENQDMIFTMKPIIEKNCPPEIQIHLRFDGKDFWNGQKDTLDIDVYIPTEEFLKIFSLIENNSSDNGKNLKDFIRGDSS
jgi:hypothetical protein